MNKTTLIIDGNWLLMSRLGAAIKDFSLDYSEAELDQASDNLVDFLARSVNKIINYFDDTIDNIMMVQDGGSWRKRVPKPALYHEEYKGNRIQDQTVSWSHIWKALTSFCTSFNSNNITCVSEHGVEGDDWCWYWSRLLNRAGTNTIIWSSDQDLQQLVQKDAETGNWTVWYNDRAGLVVNSCYQESDDFVDAMMNFENRDQDLTALIDLVVRLGSKLSYINPYDIVMKKVIAGDAGDNIKPLVRVVVKGRTNRVSERDWSKINEDLGIRNIDTFKQSVPKIINRIRAIKRLSSNSDSDSALQEMFDFNLKLVWLDKSTIPQDILRKMNSYKDQYKQFDLNFIRNNYKILTNRNTDHIQDLFETLS